MKELMQQINVMKLLLLTSASYWQSMFMSADQTHSHTGKYHGPELGPSLAQLCSTLGQACKPGLAQGAVTRTGPCLIARLGPTLVEVWSDNDGPGLIAKTGPGLVTRTGPGLVTRTGPGSVTRTAHIN
ncbi:hypothetical protein WA026_019921 [Henosepilachna vigintioctopunctata]|uniref:Secreted protein n=1 Tax=Henosepilachna vigintioctopunctata TaxID=420089 RepID=A0AAW1V2N7_9CUCU